MFFAIHIYKYIVKKYIYSNLKYYKINSLSKKVHREKHYKYIFVHFLILMILCDQRIVICYIIMYFIIYYNFNIH